MDTLRVLSKERRCRVLCPVGLHEGSPGELRCTQRLLLGALFDERKLHRTCWLGSYFAFVPVFPLGLLVGLLGKGQVAECCCVWGCIRAPRSSSFLLCPLPHSPLPKKHRANTPLGDAMCVSSNCTLVYTRAHGARSTSSHTGKHKSPRSEVLYWAARAGNQKHLCQYTLRRAVGTLVCPISMVPLWVGGAPQGFFPGVHPIRMQVVSWGVPLTASLLLGLCS